LTISSTVYSRQPGQVVDPLAIREPVLVDIDDTSERPAGAKPLGTDDEEVIVMREQDPAQRRGPLEERHVVFTTRLIILNPQNIDPFASRAVGHGPRHMLFRSSRRASLARPRAEAGYKGRIFELPTKRLRAAPATGNLRIEHLFVVVVIRQRAVELPEAQARIGVLDRRHVLARF
jgi:hypothetical protein